MAANSPARISFPCPNFLPLPEFPSPVRISFPCPNFFPLPEFPSPVRISFPCPNFFPLPLCVPVPLPEFPNFPINLYLKKYSGFSMKTFLGLRDL